MYATPLFPIRCIVSGDLWPEPAPADLLPPESPVRDVVVEPRFTIVHKPGCRPRVALIVYEDTLLMEAKVALWTCINGRAEAVETFVPLAWLSERVS